MSISQWESCVRQRTQKWIRLGDSYSRRSSFLPGPFFPRLTPATQVSHAQKFISCWNNKQNLMSLFFNHMLLSCICVATVIPPVPLSCHVLQPFLFNVACYKKHRKKRSVKQYIAHLEGDRVFSRYGLEECKPARFLLIWGVESSFTARFTWWIKMGGGDNCVVTNILISSILLHYILDTCKIPGGN